MVICEMGALGLAIRGDAASERSLGGCWSRGSRGGEVMW